MKSLLASLLLFIATSAHGVEYIKNIVTGRPDAIGARRFSQLTDSSTIVLGGATKYSQLTDSMTAVPFASTATYASNADKLNGYNASEIVAISTGLIPTPDLSAYLSTTTAANTYLAITGKAADSDKLDGFDSSFFLSTNTAISGGTQYWIGTATNTLDMGNFGITNSSYTYIGIATGIGYWDVKDKYIITDATTSVAMQALINYVPDGTHIKVITSTMTWNSQVNIFKNNITLEGNSNGTALVALPWASWSAAGHMIHSTGTSGLTIRNIKLDGLAANTGQTKNPINIQRCDYVTIQNIWVDYSDNHGMYIEGSNFVYVNNNTVTNCDSEGIYLYGYDNILGVYRGYQNIISNNEVRDCPRGVSVLYCRAPIIANNYIWGSSAWAINCAQVNYGLSITVNSIFGGTGGGVFFYGTGANGFNCSGNLISCANTGMLVQGDISAGAITNNSITITGNYNGLEIGSYNNCSNLNIIGNTITNAGNTKASINAYDMSNSLVAFNNCSNTATGKSEQAFLLQKGTGNVIVSNLAYLQDTADYQIDAFCYQNQLLNNTAKDGVKIINNGRDTCLQTLQDCKWGFGVSSATATVDIGGDIKVSGGMYPASGASLPTSGYKAGSFFYNTSDFKMYHSTCVVTDIGCWVNP